MLGVRRFGTGVLFAGTLLLFSLSPWFLLALPVVLLANLFAAVFQTTNSTAIQALVPDSVRGRVMSLMMMTFGLTPLGTVPVAVAAEAWGAPVAIAGAAVATAVLTVLVYLASAALRSLDGAMEAWRAAMEDEPLRAAMEGPAPEPVSARP